MLISWTRLLNFQFTDPRIGRDLLIGVLIGVLTNIVILSLIFLGLNPRPLAAHPFALLGTNELLGDILPQLVGTRAFGHEAQAVGREGARAVGDLALADQRLPARCLQHQVAKGGDNRGFCGHSQRQGRGLRDLLVGIAQMRREACDEARSDGWLPGRGCGRSPS